MLGYSENRILRVQAEGVCPFIIDTEIVEVTNPVTGRTWMDRNIGATRAATSMNDSAAYGHLFQWGRSTDGHEYRNSGTTDTLSDDDCPGHGSFIITRHTPYDWRSSQNDSLWQGIIADGWRLPTIAELNAERQSWNSNNSLGAFASPLKLTLAGLRTYTGNFQNVDLFGFLWSSTVDGISAQNLYFYGGGAGASKIGRSVGRSVRLIKD